jgi:hypothetical protein
MYLACESIEGGEVKCSGGCCWIGVGASQLCFFLLLLLLLFFLILFCIFYVVFLNDV